jgi:hypothetical protein
MGIWVVVDMGKINAANAKGDPYMVENGENVCFLLTSVYLKVIVFVLPK